MRRVAGGCVAAGAWMIACVLTSRRSACGESAARDQRGNDETAKKPTGTFTTGRMKIRISRQATPMPASSLRQKSPRAAEPEQESQRHGENGEIIGVEIRRREQGAVPSAAALIS